MKMQYPASSGLGRPLPTATNCFQKKRKGLQSAFLRARRQRRARKLEEQ